MSATFSGGGDYGLLEIEQSNPIGNTGNGDKT
ncbi:hypothetical protein Caci_3683 [Catenulispora acidiphila DSM 44928]|uniref:Uncharacterized protein n=1 Tax=Catenulispora acidiphila (strain DSM 44928 / JCM 14897 / NBRC 102108 / NRRL B-24433 / ID139908) TaxID=479433 RepID=C7QBW6_CATAD|nr:hypothetical protein Caci_3683 [Catenulispora acidiphila DSM 44928]